VHESSKDAFYESEKQRYKGFRIAKITYSDNFTKAEVVLSIDVDWYTPRTGKLPVSAPMKSSWKYDQGQWWYYIPTDKREWETPFGVMHPGAETPTGQRPVVVLPDAKTILNRVEVTKLDVMLSSWQKSEDYTEIHNGMPGDISLQLEPYLLPGLTVKIDKPVVHANETARIVFSYNPPDRSAKATRNIRVRETPTGTTYIFTLRFAVPPELEKYLKK